MSGPHICRLHSVSQLTSYQGIHADITDGWKSVSKKLHNINGKSYKNLSVRKLLGWKRKQDTELHVKVSISDFTTNTIQRQINTFPWFHDLKV
jgi:hypothetical protein